MSQKQRLLDAFYPPFIEKNNNKTPESPPPLLQQNQAHTAVRLSPFLMQKRGHSMMLLPAFYKKKQGHYNFCLITRILSQKQRYAVALIPLYTNVFA